jgi:hypothetical protein
MWSFLRGALLPNPNPIGFGPADFLELALAALLIAVAVAWRPWLGPRCERLARRTVVCMLLLAAAPVVLRLLLLPHHPAPTPDVYDEFSHLLVADTLRHFRLANPAHALPQFFETFFTLQQPTYSSIYPLGPGLLMAIGWNLFGLPWGGVLLAAAAFCALTYWMLRGWTTPGWALAGGILAVIEFGPLCQWTNSYWGGGLAATAGCLVFGALPRLRERPRIRDGALLGLGLALHVLVRQFESVFLFLAVALFLLPEARHALRSRMWLRPAAAAALALAPAVLLTLAQNHAVTGSWTTLPEQLSQYEYGVPAGLTFQTPPTPHHPLTAQQAAEYQAQLAFFQGPETPGSYLLRLQYRVRFYRFFFLPPLYLAALAFLARLREWRFAWVAATLALFALGTNFFPAFQYHYIAAVSCLFLLVCVAGLEQLSRLTIRGQAVAWEAAGILLLLCGGQFLFWYGAHLADDAAISQDARQYETWDGLNHQNPARRIFVAGELAQIPGKLLVFVHYVPHHIFQDEWVYNAADIDGSRVVWARDLGTAENEKLLHYYPDRVAILLDPDSRPPQLRPYEDRPNPTPILNDAIR